MLDKRSSACLSLCQQRTTGFFEVLIEVLCLSHACTIVDNLPDGFDHRNWMLGLPDVPAHINSDRSFADCLVRELERVQLGLQFRPSCYDQRNWRPSWTRSSSRTRQSAKERS